MWDAGVTWEIWTFGKNRVKDRTLKWLKVGKRGGWGCVSHIGWNFFPQIGSGLVESCMREGWEENKEFGQTAVLHFNPNKGVWWSLCYSDPFVRVLRIDLLGKLCSVIIWILSINNIKYLGSWSHVRNFSCLDYNTYYMQWFKLCSCKYNSWVPK